MTRLGFVILAACSAAPAMKSPPPRPRVVKLAELGDVRAFRNYVAVIGVGPHGAHFTAWYHHIEPGYTRVVAYSDGAGHLVISEEAGGWGGIAMPPRSLPAIPHDTAKLARTVEDELQRRHPGARDWQLRFDGFSRTVAITELIAHDFASGTRRAGWNAHLDVAMDRELAKVEHVISSQSGFGLIEVPADAQWVELPFAGDGRELLVSTGVPPSLVTSIGEAAQRYAANAASPPVASLVPPGGRMLPDGYVAQVAAKISIYGRAARGNGFDRELRVPLDLSAAVFGDRAAGEAVASIDDRRYTVRVVLTPAAPRKPVAGHTSDRYAGTLAVHVDDNQGHAWDHAYPASGKLELEGDQVVAPAGLEIPGASAPSTEHDALHGQLPGFGKSTIVDVYVAVDVFAEPRR
jgi:hypothetical protein